MQGGRNLKKVFENDAIEITEIQDESMDFEAEKLCERKRHINIVLAETSGDISKKLRADDKCLSTPKESDSSTMKDKKIKKYGKKDSCNERAVSVSQRQKTNTVDDASDKSNNVTEKTQSSIRRPLIYEAGSRGPFLVHIRTHKDETKKLSILEISRKLNKANVKYENFTVVSKNQWKIQCSSRSDANNITSNKFLAEMKLEAYIPFYLLRRKGVIYDVPFDISMEELQGAINEENPVQVFNAHRMKRKDKCSGTWIESETVCLEFSGQHLPEAIKIWKAGIRVKPFIPSVRMCYVCGKIGHISKVCTNPRRCLDCGQNHEIVKDIRCQEPKKCINCQGDHFTMDGRSCPKILLQKAILREMALNNISFLEAKNRSFQSKEGMSNFSPSSIQSTVKTPSNFPHLAKAGASSSGGAVSNLRPYAEAVKGINSLEYIKDLTRKLVMLLDTVDNTVPGFPGRAKWVQELRGRFAPTKLDINNVQ